MTAAEETSGALPVTQKVIDYLKGMFPPDLIDEMVREGEYKIVDKNEANDNVNKIV